MSTTRLLSLASIALVALVLASCGGGSSGSTPAAGAGPSVGTSSTALGSAVVDGSGRTLYLFGKDAGRRSMCSGSCAANWPPFTATSAPKSGGGVPASALSLVPRSDGKRQVALDGHPLYFYAGDQSAGQLNGQGQDAFGAKWYIVSPSGRRITGQAATTSSRSGYGY